MLNWKALLRQLVCLLLSAIIVTQRRDGGSGHPAARLQKNRTNMLKDGHYDSGRKRNV